LNIKSHSGKPKKTKQLHQLKTETYRPKTYHATDIRKKYAGSLGEARDGKAAEHRVCLELFFVSFFSFKRKERKRQNRKEFEVCMMLAIMP